MFVRRVDSFPQSPWTRGDADLASFGAMAPFGVVGFVRRSWLRSARWLRLARWLALKIPPNQPLSEKMETLGGWGQAERARVPRRSRGTLRLARAHNLPFSSGWGARRCMTIRLARWLRGALASLRDGFVRRGDSFYGPMPSPRIVKEQSFLITIVSKATFVPVFRPAGIGRSSRPRFIDCGYPVVMREFPA